MTINFSRFRSRLDELRHHPGFRHNPPLTLARIATWAVHCACRVPARVRLRRAQIRLYLPPKWRGGGATSVYVFRELYEPEFLILERLLKPDMVFVDAGANTGAFTFWAARLVGESGAVVALEPGQRCVNALRESMQLNQMPQVSIRAEALADECGVTRLYHHAGQDNSFSLGADPNSEVSYDEVQTITLPALLEEHQLPRVDFLKLDVEGAQEPALRGGLEIVLRDLPYLLIENHQEACVRMGLDPLGAFTLLHELGYGFYQTQPHGVLRRLPSAEGVRTVLAVHPNRGCPEGASS